MFATMFLYAQSGVWIFMNSDWKYAASHHARQRYLSIIMGDSWSTPTLDLEAHG